MRKSSPPRPRRAAGADAVSAMRRRMMRTGLALVLVFAVVDGVFGERGLLNNMNLRQRNASRKASNEELSAQNDALTEEIRRLREDPAAVEELARRQLGLIRDGELLIIMHDTPPSAQAPADARTDGRSSGAPSR